MFLRLFILTFLILLSVVYGFDFHHAPKANLTIAVVCGQHTIFIATGIVLGLRRIHITANMLFDIPSVFSHDYYIILTPQIFDMPFPPKSQLIIYQLEQTAVSNRWMKKKYMKNLKKGCKAIVDYKMQNIEFLREKGVGAPMAYLPISPVPGIDTLSKAGDIVSTDTVASARKASAAVKDFDILFYGDASKGRRKLLLAAAKEAFPGRVKSVSNVFGPPIHKLIKSAKVVLNIHYYENGMLETPRLFETLSLGVPVVSEDSADRHLYPELDGVVSFFDLDSVESMTRALTAMLKHPPQQFSFDRFYSAADRKFQLMLQRFLIQNSLVPPHYYKRTTILESDVPSQNIVLSPPEFFSRRARFEQVVPRDSHFSVYDGFLYPVRWMGCAMAYARVAQYAVMHNFDQLTVCEDDVLFPENYSTEMARVQRYLATQGHWDYFAGLVAVVPDDVNVTKVDAFEGKLYATIDTASSAVFNIYNRSMLQRMAVWDTILRNDLSFRDLQRYATIDRHMVNDGANIVVQLPFFAGHAPDIVSTLWAKRTNEQMYGGNIRRTEALLLQKAEAFARNKAESKFISALLRPWLY